MTERNHSDGKDGDPGDKSNDEPLRAPSGQSPAARKAFGRLGTINVATSCESRRRGLCLAEYAAVA